MARLDPLSREQFVTAEKPGEKMAPPTFGPGVKRDEVAPAPPAATVREELARQAALAEAKISIQVMGVGGGRAGTYEMPYRRGAPIKQYLALINMVRLAAGSRVYDLTYLSLGRRRLNYVLQPDSRILIGSIDYSPAGQLQRKQGEAYELSRNMGGGAREVEVSMAYDRSGKPLAGKPLAGKEGAAARGIDELDVDQI